MKKIGRPCVKQCISCPICDKEFSVHRYRLKTGKQICCSNSCKYKLITLNGTTTNKCIQCNEKFQFTKGRNVDRPIANKYCSQHCYNIGRNKSGMIPYRILAFENFPHHCHFCNFDSGMLDVHHIDEDRTNNQLANLVILCRSCHAKLHSLGS
tara:strand:+ start:2112 stop:2570 length:459 start_codon:yes stop_codon:yes gene_type:complete